MINRHVDGHVMEKFMNHLSPLHRYSDGFSNSGPGGVSLLTILFVVLGALASASAQSPAPILVAYAGQNETVGPMWVGIEKGTFKKYGLDVRLVQLRTGSLSMATLSSGQVQYNYGSPGNALSADLKKSK